MVLPYMVAQVLGGLLGAALTRVSTTKTFDMLPKVQFRVFN